MNWREVCDDKRLENLPFKIELNQQGQIVMSPTNKEHAWQQGKIIRLLNQLIPHGNALPELAVDTADNTKTPDVVWVSEERWRSMADAPSCSRAPEICIEVLSPSNSRSEMDRKRQLYFDAGADECWECDSHGRMTFYDRTGPLKTSRLCPDFPATI
jgi:Uma2 family endonuclease